MNYIQSGEFLTQSIMVQKIFMDWKFDKWEIGDMMQDSTGDYIIFSYCEDYPPYGEVFGLVGANETTCLKTRSVQKYEWIPLLKETELRNFIKEKLADEICILYTCDGYEIGKAFDYDNMYKTGKQNLLQAYWYVACILAGKIEVKIHKYFDDKGNTFCKKCGEKVEGGYCRCFNL